MKYGLALHTTTPELGLAINQLTEATENFVILRSQVWHLQREVSNLLHQYLLDFLPPQTWQDLGLIAVAAGPGGFTGTRIGVVAARTFAQQLGIPVFTISTLAAYAWHISQKSLQKLPNQQNILNIAVQMPAQRGQLFAAIYQINVQQSQMTPILSDSVFSPSAWQEYLDNYHDNYQLVMATSGLAATVTSILQLATKEYQQGKRPHWSQAKPFYGQNPV